jgi:glycosyltransferase involved in cell wall biosynthesis
MKVAVTYDFATHPGGGDFVMLNILHTLKEVGLEVDLLTSRPEGLQKSASFFEVKTPAVNLHYIKLPPYFKHPYSMAYIACKATKLRYDIYVVSDDLPKCLAQTAGINYIHYPHAARLKHKEYIADKYKHILRGKLIWKLHEFLFPRLFMTKGKPSKWLFIANSLVTQQHVKEVFNITDVMLLHPPVRARKIYNIWKERRASKENIIISIGRLEPEKRILDVLHAFSRVASEIDTKLYLIGFSKDERNLLEIVKQLNISNKVKVLINAPRKTVVETLLRAKALVHAAAHEPFGIAVVEGMAAGCIPIVRQGFNGPWLEITKEGRYGIGFSNIEELANAIKIAIQKYDTFNIESISLRALDFDEEIFHQKFTVLVKQFLAQL